MDMETEAALFARYRGGDKRAGDEIARSAERVVRGVAWRSRSGIDREELQAQAWLGVAEAIPLFKPNGPARFKTYAARAAHNEVSTLAVGQCRAVAFTSKGAHAVALAWWRTREADPVRMAAIAGVSVETAASVLPLVCYPDERIDEQPRSHEGNDYDRYADPSPTPEEATQGADANRVAHDLLATLPDMERDILWRHCNGETFATIGKRYDLTAERIRQIEAAALALLRRRAGAPPSTATVSG